MRPDPEEVARRDACYPPEARIRRRPEFRRTFDEGAKTFSRSVIVYVVPREPPQGGARLGVVASRKVGGAVVRNAVKRRMREAFRRLRADVTSSIDVVMVATRRTVGVPSDDILRDLRTVLSARGLCR